MIPPILPPHLFGRDGAAAPETGAPGSLAGARGRSRTRTKAADPAYPASPAFLRFDFVKVKAGPGRRKPAPPGALARSAERFIEALTRAVPEPEGDLGRAITDLKTAADRRIMQARRRRSQP